MTKPAAHRTAAALPIRVMAALALALAVATGSHLGLAEAQEAGGPRSDPAAYTREFVQQAVDRFELSGLEDTVEYYNTPESTDGQWYVFIYDIRPVLIADAENPNMVGRNASRVLGSNGYPLGEAIVGAARANPEGVWLEYNFLDPATGRYETKHLWVVLHNLLVFGSGWYETGPSRSQLSGFTKQLVQQAIGLYEAAGRDRTVEYYNSARSIDGQWYVFMADEEGVLIAEPAMPADVGQSLLGDAGVDETGYPFGLDLLTATGDGLWVSYRALNPDSGEVERKTTWIVRHDGLHFASGWYGAPPRIIGLPATGDRTVPTGWAVAAGVGGLFALLAGCAALAIERRRRAG